MVNFILALNHTPKFEDHTLPACWINSLLGTVYTLA